MPLIEGWLKKRTDNTQVWRAHWVSLWHKGPKEVLEMSSDRSTNLTDCFPLASIIGCKVVAGKDSNGRPDCFVLELLAGRQVSLQTTDVNERNRWVQTVNEAIQQQFRNCEDESVVPVPHGLECPICLELLTDPVSTMDGCCYCRVCINRWFKVHDDRNAERRLNGQDEIECRAPATNAPLSSRYLHPVLALRQAVEAYRLSIPTLVAQERQRRDLCDLVADLQEKQASMPSEQEQASLTAEVQHLRSCMAGFQELLSHADADRARIVSLEEQLHLASAEQSRLATVVEQLRCARFDPLALEDIKNFEERQEWELNGDMMFYSGSSDEEVSFSDSSDEEVVFCKRFPGAFPARQRR